MTGQKTSKGENGIALVSVLGMGALFLMVGMAVVRLLDNHSKSESSADRYQEIMMLRKTIETYIDCRNTLRLNYDSTAPSCNSGTYILKDKAGRPLFPEKSSNQFVAFNNAYGASIVSWELRTKCKDNALVVERKFGKDTKNTFLNRFEALWPDSSDPHLCASYFAPQKTCSGTYDIYAGLDVSGPLCCRLVEESGLGGAIARCGKTEYLAHGGAYCAPVGKISASGIDSARRTEQRCVLDESALLAGHLGQGSARGFGMTSPSLIGAHVDPASPALMQGMMTYPRTKSMKNSSNHGGFLLQSGYTSLNGSLTVDSWVAACKIDDWEGGFTATARAYCCPKKGRN